MLRTVLRAIPGIDASLGDVIEVSGWRNARQLENTRFLGPVIVSEDDARPAGRPRKQSTKTPE
jgi:hypothetical protein